DTTAPVVTGQPDRVPDSNGWYRQPVTVTWTVFDPDSPATTPPPTTVNRDGSGVVVTSEPSCDPSNNCATGTFVLSLDQTGPTLIGQAKTPPNPAGWYRDDVAIQWTCSDALSGIPVGGCPSDSPITAEGRGLSVSASVSDRVGNRTDATSVPVNIDRTAPVTSS